MDFILFLHFLYERGADSMWGYGAYGLFPPAESVLQRFQVSVHMFLWTAVLQIICLW